MPVGSSSIFVWAKRVDVCRWQGRAVILETGKVASLPYKLGFLHSLCFILSRYWEFR
jgi:hypothetical protein